MSQISNLPVDNILMICGKIMEENNKRIVELKKENAELKNQVNKWKECCYDDCLMTCMKCSYPIEDDDQMRICNICNIHYHEYHGNIRLLDINISENDPIYNGVNFCVECFMKTDTEELVSFHPNNRLYSLDMCLMVYDKIETLKSNTETIVFIT